MSYRRELAFERRWAERHDCRFKQQHQSRKNMIAKRDNSGRFTAKPKIEDPFSNRMKLSNLPYNPTFDPSTFERAKKWAVDHRQNRAGNATFAQIWDPKDGQPGQIREFIDQICHANINNGETGMALVVSVNKEPPVGDEPFRHRWYEWLFLESPYKDFILSDLEFAHTGIILSTDMPSIVLQNILILTRHGWEIQKGMYDLWVSCVDNGIPGWLAYATLMNSKGSHAGYGGREAVVWSETDYYLPHQAQHRAHWLMDLQTLTNFRHGIVGLYPITSPREHYMVDLDKRLKSTYRMGTNFYGGTCLFDDSCRNMHSPHYVQELLGREDFREIMKGRRMAVRQAIPDPFTRANVVPPGGLTYRDVVEVAMPFVLEHGLTDIAIHDPINNEEKKADGPVPEGVPQAHAAVREAAAA